MWPKFAQSTIMGTIKRGLFLSVVGLIVTTPLADAAEEYEGRFSGLLNYSLEELGSVQFYTDNRVLTPIEDAPAIVTLITAEDIERHGHKTLKDILDRVPGFFNPIGTVGGAMITSRGFTQDQNMNFLLLIDGHAQNMTSVYGMHNQHIYPFLYNVERVEIVRGPGSTLWGSDATLGVIHIITKDGRQTSGTGSLEASYDYQFRDDRETANIMYAKQFDTDSDIILSYTRTESSGEGEDYINGGIRAPGVPSKYQSWPVSQDLYFKGNWREFTLTSRYTEQQVISPKGDWTRRRDEALKQKWLELSHFKEFSEDLSLETKVFYDNNKHTRVFTRQPSDVFINLRTYRDEKYGAESILRYMSENNLFLLGLNYDYLKLGPNEGEKETDPVKWSLTESGTEHGIAVFAEDTYKGFDDWTLTLGGRLDDNDFRGEDLAFLPRAAALYSINEKMTVKYAFNTGHVRPLMVYMLGEDGYHDSISEGVYNRVRVGADKPQEITSHDIQLYYDNNVTMAAITVFHVTVDNLINYVQGTPGTIFSIDGIPHQVTYDNIGSVTSQGVEIEFRQKVGEKANIYGNFAYALAKYDDTILSIDPTGAVYDLKDGSLVSPEDTMTGVPQYLWNLGMEWKPVEDLFLNFHYRAWTDAWIRTARSPNEFGKIGPEHYFDISLLYTDFLMEDQKMSIYGKNIFNNQNAVPVARGWGYSNHPGAEFGIQVSFVF